MIRLKQKKGQGMVEYVLIIALIAVVLIAGFQAIGTNAGTSLDNVAAQIAGT